jgi:multidrug resistance efflux pump
MRSDHRHSKAIAEILELSPQRFETLTEILESSDESTTPLPTTEEEIADPSARDPITGGAAELQARLAVQVRSWDQASTEAKSNTTPSWQTRDSEINPEPAKESVTRKVTAWRVVKTLLALAAIAALGWTPLLRLLETTSAEATVNARLVTLRAPIDGTVLLSSQFADVGTTIVADEQLVRITNPRADRSQLDNLRRTISGIEAERDALQRRKSQLEDLQGQLRNQRDAFQKGRVDQLEARVAELTADIAAAMAKQDETASALDRAKRLRTNGYQTQAILDASERDHKVAVNAAEGLRQRLVGAKVELDAARTGLFVGDSYNDIPRTAQRLDEITQQVIDLGGQIDEKALRIAQLQAEMAEEEKRFALRSTAIVTAPVSGRVWEILTSDGELVTQGQNLLRVLDCGGVLVTAAVSEAVYNSLRLGQPATFHLRGESEERKGHVAGLNGLATVAANMAIEQDALVREPYHVSVEIPGLANGPDCYVGRTGKVTFDTATGVSAATNQ